MEFFASFSRLTAHGPSEIFFEGSIELQEVFQQSTLYILKQLLTTRVLFEQIFVMDFLTKNFTDFTFSDVPSLFLLSKI